MSIGLDREEIIRARVYDVKQLLGCVSAKPMAPDDVLTHLFVRLTAAHYALSNSRQLERTASEHGHLAVDSFSRDAEQMLDRAKGMLEFDVPMLMLSSVPASERRTIVAEVVELFRRDELISAGIAPLVKAHLGISSGTARFNCVDFDEAVAWFKAVTDATIEADQAAQAAAERVAAPQDKGRWQRN